jgi:hypothetical protein
MTNKIQQITTLTLAAILIAGSFSLTPFAYSTGSNYNNNNWNHDDGDDDQSNPQIEHELCKKAENLINNGCFEDPEVANSKGWDIFDSTDTALKWEVTWKDENPCEDFPGILPQLELQRGILDGPAEEEQHAELDSDCNGPSGTGDGEEHTSVAIAQKTKVATTESDKYTITFAYKARPGKNVDIDNNGLTVEWNGADVTPSNLKFNKKDWKYASVTVNGINGLSELKFIDSGEKSDTLGTFLDDVSVIKVPKPTTKITLFKEFVGGSIPNGFELKINNMPVNIGEENSYDVEEFTITENAPNYVATFDEDCPFTAMGQIVHLDLGSVVECTILNTFVPPPTITIKKVIGQDNTDALNEIELENENPFHFYITNTQTDEEIEITTANQIVPSGTYTLREEIDEPYDEDDFEFILITGDDGCPTMVEDMEEFTLFSGEHLTCVVYNDDDKDALPGGAPDGPGVIFEYDTMQWDPQSTPACTSGGQRPCITDLGSGSKYLVIPDFADNLPGTFQSMTTSTLVLLTVLDLTDPETSIGCQASGKGTFEDESGFLMVCPGVGGVDTHNFNINYALIETDKTLSPSG